MKDYDYFLIAKEFGTGSVDVVLDWPMTKIWRHRLWLQKYYENMYPSQEGSKKSTLGQTQRAARSVKEHTYQFK